LTLVLAAGGSGVQLHLSGHRRPSLVIAVAGHRSWSTTYGLPGRAVISPIEDSESARASPQVVSCVRFSIPPSYPRAGDTRDGDLTCLAGDAHFVPTAAASPHCAESRGSPQLVPAKDHS
jgi:hypothetical protein